MRGDKQGPITRACRGTTNTKEREQELAAVQQQVAMHMQSDTDSDGSEERCVSNGHSESTANEDLADDNEVMSPSEGKYFAQKELPQHTGCQGKPRAQRAAKTSKLIALCVAKTPKLIALCVAIGIAAVIFIGLRPPAAANLAFEMLQPHLSGSSTQEALAFTYKMDAHMRPNKGLALSIVTAGTPGSRNLSQVLQAGIENAVGAVHARCVKRIDVTDGKEALERAATLQGTLATLYISTCAHGIVILDGLADLDAATAMVIKNAISNNGKFLLNGYTFDSEHWTHILVLHATPHMHASIHHALTSSSHAARQDLLLSVLKTSIVTSEHSIMAATWDTFVKSIDNLVLASH